MGILTGVVAPTSSIIAQSSQATQQSGRTDNPAANPNAVQQAIANSGQAVVASLSSDSRRRAASSGSSRMTDAAFEKQELKKKEEKKESGEAEATTGGNAGGRAVNVTA